ncbi:MAG: peptidoglycan DD-metalloendopeptidase family protein [Cyclobacteriaceae bacterium]|nr:peptidoglycan DD-metalloendopeptidase family protein [Cyclobacteriaceae bacterium HetDA_MAG_MS6]
MCLPNTAGNRILLLLIFAGFSFLAFGQKTKNQLEAEKKENLRKIAEAEKILLETETEKKATLGQLTAINQQIKARESLISSLNQEVRLLDGEISDLTIVVTSLQRDLKNLKDEYAAMIYSAYKANRGFSTLTFLFSSRTFNQLFLRMKYLEQYAEARKTQAEQIEVVTDQLNKQRGNVEIKRREQRVLLNQQIRENRKLVGLKNKQDQVIAELSKKESSLKREVTDRKKAIERLDNLIAEFVRSELDRSNTLSSVDIANEAEITSLFEQNKNKLSWPVASGFISKKFGVHPHPVLKVPEQNNGVEIQTSGSERVKVVFDGEVKTKAFIPGYNNVVIVKHGNYFTVYSRLKNVIVDRGQKLKSGDDLGEVFTDAEGVSEVHFEVWKNTQKLDPEKWLTR